VAMVTKTTSPSLFRGVKVKKVFTNNTLDHSTGHPSSLPTQYSPFKVQGKSPNVTATTTGSRV
jgi:hypothetical protein